MSITKINITNGVYWVEIKEVNLRILCGSPADSVKHLIKKGLSLWVEKNGVKYETGPNVILLSDISIQNGQLSNLCEFPVLQMFYRQGMIVPDHPNNDGTKPILIGSARQITSQMNYIYRGNYGLISKEEIVQAGYSSKKADEIMRMKLKFAFGKMINTNDLLGKIILEENKKTLIKNDVYIKRVDTNIFQISYKDSNVTVDLNLEKKQKYESPYPLNYYNIKREYFSVIHSGQGDGWNTDQPCMSSILMYQGKIYLIDAGPNIKYILESLGFGMNEVEGIFHTHSHDDHFVGLPSIIRSDKKIKYYSTKLIRKSVFKKLSALLNIEEDTLYDYFDVVDLSFDRYNDIDGLEVKPVFSPHPVETNMFMFRTLWKDGYKKYAHYADLTSFDVLKKMITNDKSKVGISKSFFEKTKEIYLSYADIKKIDAGGGMIHGQACDFKNDKSKEIILAHSSTKYTDEDKEIGSSAAFGTLDILIKTNKNYEHQKAAEYLSESHPDLPKNILNTFSNLDIESFNPGTIFLKKDEKVDNIFVLLSGVAESIYSDSSITSSLTAGSIIGMMDGILKFDSLETVRAVSYVKVLKIPSKMFLNAVTKYGMYNKIESRMNKLFFLKENTLFNEDISYPVLEKIAHNLKLKSHKKGNFFSLKEKCKLYVINNGAVDVKLGNKKVNVLQRGDFFGEECMVFETSGAFNYIAHDNTSVYEIDGDVIKNVPIIRWKLFESLKKKQKIILRYNSKFMWNERFKINVQSMDIQHERIFSIINSIYVLTTVDDNKYKKDELIELTNSLISYIKYHLKHEEDLLKLYNYPHFEEHCQRHQGLMTELYLFLEQVKEDKEIDSQSVVTLFYDWLVGHIEVEDKKYSKFLNDKGVY